MEKENKPIHYILFILIGSIVWAVSIQLLSTDSSYKSFLLPLIGWYSCLIYNEIFD